MHRIVTVEFGSSRVMSGAVGLSRSQSRLSLAEHLLSSQFMWLGWLSYLDAPLPAVCLISVLTTSFANGEVAN